MHLRGSVAICPAFREHLPKPIQTSQQRKGLALAIEFEHRFSQTNLKTEARHRHNKTTHLRARRATQRESVPDQYHWAE